MISTRGRYALRVLIDLAEHGGEQYLPMKEVASRQEISLKYLERILPLLTKSGYVEGQHGKGGGYRLKKNTAGHSCRRRFAAHRRRFGAGCLLNSRSRSLQFCARVPHT